MVLTGISSFLRVTLVLTAKATGASTATAVAAEAAAAAAAVVAAAAAAAAVTIARQRAATSTATVAALTVIICTRANVLTHNVSSTFIASKTYIDNHPLQLAHTRGSAAPFQGFLQPIDSATVTSLTTVKKRTRMPVRTRMRLSSFSP